MGFPALAPILIFIEHRVQLLGHQVGLLGRLAALAVQQRHLGGLPHVFHRNLGATLVGGDGAGCFVHYDVAPHSIHLVFGTDIGDQSQNLIANLYLSQQFLAAQQPLSFRLLGFLPRKQGERRRRLQEIAAAGKVLALCSGDIEEPLP